MPPAETVPGDTKAPSTDTDPVDTNSASTQCAPREAVVPTADFFVDISAESGIQVGNYDPQPAQSIPINDHSRLAVVDIDGDGWDDLVAHSLFPNPQAGIPFEHLVFRNNGDGTFSDFSDASNLRNVPAGFFLFGDVDNDGDQDVFAGVDIMLPGVTHQVLLNDGAGHFTVKAGSGPDSLPQTIAANGVFADFNGDAKLDLFIGNGHTGFSAPDLYFEGNGDGTFVNATHKLPNNAAHPTNGTVTRDYDNDGDLDIFVSTYGVSSALGLNLLWENQGGSFVNVAVERGFASLATGNTWLGLDQSEEPNKAPGSYMGSNGFGIDCKDVTNDGLMDVFLTTISHPVEADYSRKWSDPTQLLVNQGAENDYAFVNEYVSRGLPFNEGDVDGAIIDFDNDGRLDLSVSRDKKYEKNYSDTALDQKAWFGLMRQLAGGNFQSMGVESGINSIDAVLDASLTDCVSDADCTAGVEQCLKDRCRRPCASTADCAGPDEICHSGGFCKLQLTMKNAQNHAWADFDHDGDLDLLVGGRDTGGGRPNFLFRNEIGSQNRWLSIRLEGDGVQVNRDAIGARVSLVFADQTLMRELRSSRGMHSSADSRALHFGLGELGCDYTMVVRWPDGTEVSFSPSDYPEESFLRLSYPDQLELVSTP